MEKKTICIDFDGVIHDYSNGWQGEDVFGQMIPNADTGTSVLKQKGWTVIIFTTRKKTDELEKWLKEHNIAYDYINENPGQPDGTSGKIMADVYLDDRVFVSEVVGIHGSSEKFLILSLGRNSRKRKLNNWLLSMTRETAFGSEVAKGE